MVWLPLPSKVTRPATELLIVATTPGPGLAGSKVQKAVTSAVLLSVKVPITRRWKGPPPFKVTVGPVGSRFTPTASERRFAPLTVTVVVATLPPNFARRVAVCGGWLGAWARIIGQGIEVNRPLETCATSGASDS